MSERCACGAFELDKVPSRQHGRSCTPGSPSSEYDRPCPVEWCRLLDGHGGLHLAIPEVQRLRAALAEAEERARTHEHNALMQRNEGVRLLARAESAERARDGWQEEARTYCQNATFQREKRDAAEASLAQARAECDAARAGLENQARDYTRRCEQLAQAREVLRDVEWAQKTTRLKDGGTIYTAVTCPCCGGEKDPPKRHRYKEPEPVGGHAPGCALASALGRGK